MTDLAAEPREAAEEPVAPAARVRPRSPWLAAGMSFFVPGLGQFNEAVQVEQPALHLAAAARQEELVRRFEEALKRYQAQQPTREGPGS